MKRIINKIKNNFIPKNAVKTIVEENIIIRVKILELLYLVNQENKKTNLKGISNKLNIEEEKLKPNLKFLRDENLIDYPQDINGNPISAWGQRGGIFITNKGIEIAEELIRKKKEGIKKFTGWAIRNVPWIVPVISRILKI